MIPPPHFAPPPLPVIQTGNPFATKKQRSAFWFGFDATLGVLAALVFVHLVLGLAFGIVMGILALIGGAIR